MSSAQAIQNDLFDYIDQHLYVGSDDLERFKLLLRHFLRDIHLQPQKKFSEICSELLRKDVIRIGDYKEIIEVLQKIDVRLANEVREKEEEIRVKALECDTVPYEDVTSSVKDVSVELLLDFVASELGQEVTILASCLDIDQVTVGKIEYEYPRNPHEKNFHILYSWRIQYRNGDYSIPLKGALHEQGRNDIVEIIQDFRKDKYKCPNIPSPETRVKDKDLITVANELSTNIYRVGRFLNVPQTRINQIKEDKVNSIVEQGYEILAAWKQSKAGHATRQWLCDGLVYIKSQSTIDKLVSRWNQTNE